MAHLDIVVSADADMVDFSRSDAQLGIRYGSAGTEGLAATCLGRDSLMPVCSAAYADSMAIRGPEDLDRCLLLHDTFWSDDWARWLADAGVAESLGGEGQFFTHYSMAIDTARAGGGIAMGHRLLLRDFIARGELVCPLQRSIAARQEYFVVVPEKSAHLDYVKRFRDWLVAAFGETAAGA